MNFFFFFCLHIYVYIFSCCYIEIEKFPRLVARGDICCFIVLYNILHSAKMRMGRGDCELKYTFSVCREFHLEPAGNQLEQMSMAVLHST